MSSSVRDLSFSQREGHTPVPAQLKLGEVTQDLRNYIIYAFSEEIVRETESGSYGSWFSKNWNGVAKDFHVFFLKKPISSFKDEPLELSTRLEQFISTKSFFIVFDLVEFFLSDERCSPTFTSDLERAFAQARAAYRVLDNRVIAVGSEEQSQAILASIERAEQIGAKAARNHLVAAGSALTAGSWAESIRESIHSVESLARVYVPDAPTLGPALKELEKHGHLHGALKTAFSQLYGYSSDEEGIRHALVFQNKANVDEADALFMLGACASFVNYLTSRSANSANS